MRIRTRNWSADFLHTFTLNGTKIEKRDVYLLLASITLIQNAANYLLIQFERITHTHIVSV